MTKRNEISDEVREDAAILCAAMADWWAGWPPGNIPSPRAGWSGTHAERVADAASDAAIRAGNRGGLAVAYREAEALLRDGWCPGDPIYRRKVSP